MMLLLLAARFTDRGGDGAVVVLMMLISASAVPNRRVIIQNFFFSFLNKTVVTGDLLLTSTPSVIFNGVNSELDVRCSLSPNSTEISRVMAIQIEKLNGIHLRPLASIATGENAKLDTQFARKFEATVHGMMSVDTPTDSFLQVIVNIIFRFIFIYFSRPSLTTRKVC